MRMEDNLAQPLKNVLEWYREEAKDDLIQQADNEFNDALAFRYEDKQWFPEDGQVRDPVGEALYDVYVESMKWVKPQQFKKLIKRHLFHGRIESTGFTDDAEDGKYFREAVEVKVVDEFDTYFNRGRGLTGDEMRCLRDFVEDWVSPEEYVDIMAGDDSAEERDREAYAFTRIFINAICN